MKKNAPAGITYIGYAATAWSVYSMSGVGAADTNSTAGQQFAATLSDAGGRSEMSWSEYMDVRPPNNDGYLTLGEARWAVAKRQGGARHSGCKPTGLLRAPRKRFF